MRNGWLALAALLAGIGIGAARAEEPIPLRVLYAGNPGSDREKDFLALLGKHFAKVTPADFQKFTPAQADGHDVVVLDWTSIYPRDKDGKILEKFDSLNSPTPPDLPPDYGRPTILVGAAGGFVGRSLELKIDWR